MIKSFILIQILKVMKTIRENACEVGADAVLISNERPPDIWSTCYRADASIFW